MFIDKQPLKVEKKKNRNKINTKKKIHGGSYDLP